jgi:signal transduction histidine kinase/CheY-like chemotaxis protein
MKGWPHFLNWPLRAKLAALLVAASLLPLAVATFIDIREARVRFLAQTAALLAARADQLAGQLDNLTRDYQPIAARIARLPVVQEFCLARLSGARSTDIAGLHGVLSVMPSTDVNVAEVAVLDVSGTIQYASHAALIGTRLADHGYAQQALRGLPAISDVHVAQLSQGPAAAIAFAAPVLGSDREVIGMVVLWVRAAALWNVMKTFNGLAGTGSFGVLFDHQGIRIAHTFLDDMVFHPGGTLPRTTIEALIAERRFGAGTRSLLEDVRPFREPFERALADAPERNVFRSFASHSQEWNYGVGRRLESVPWTVFYLTPEASLIAQTSGMAREKILFASVITLLALVVGALFAKIIIEPIRSLTRASGSLAGGDLAIRVAVDRTDELGQLSTTFNSMAERIEVQAKALVESRDELEIRVEERTQQLARTSANLTTEVSQHSAARSRLQTKVKRLNLLHQITRAIAERQDLASIFQVVIGTLEDQLPIDFGCICLYDPAERVLTVTAVGMRNPAIAAQMAMPEHTKIEAGDNGLSRCVRGEMVYEPDIEKLPCAFARSLSRAALRSLVVAPLLVRNHVFGTLIAARLQPDGFAEGECDFLKQLTEHIALAAQQMELNGALQTAYEDLRQTQQAVIRQERLRALGQMASGIAHDINNAISPITLYTESLLEKEPNLSVQARSYLQTIHQAIGDVAQTVARMSSFYRDREPQSQLTPVQLNLLVQQVVDLTRAQWGDVSLQRGIVIQVRTELAPDLPVVMGIESEIREALANLVLNSVDAMPNGGVITLRTRVSDPLANAADAAIPQSVDLEVIDTGIGMDDNTRGRCLEPFFTTKGERGTGLGLAMVYGVAERNHAEIEIESSPGRGTTMRLKFPVTAVPAAAPPLPLNVADLPLPLRILIVDDDPMLLRSLRDALEGDGHSVIAAGTGQSGIDTFRGACDGARPFSVVITDLGMPYVDGRKVAAAVKSASPSTPVIMLTGWGQRMVQEGDVPAQVDVLLNKPPRLPELRSALARCCTPMGRAA